MQFLVLMLVILALVAGPLADNLFGPTVPVLTPDLPVSGN